MASTCKKRFAEFTHEEIVEKRQKTVPISTVRANKKAQNLLDSYVQEKGLPVIDYHNITAPKLDEILSKFYLEARTTAGDYYKTASIQNFRHGINRLLNSPPYNRDIDIIKGPEFHESCNTYVTAVRELKSMGKGEVKHYPEIEPADLKKIYASMNNNSPQALALKVQFDIRFFFCRRGAENLYGMNKNTFVIKINSSGEEYVSLVAGTLDKNHSENDKEMWGAFMPARPDSNKCPVKSFKTMLSKLHPQCDSLWQRPRLIFSENDDIWFSNSRLGQKTLASFMPYVSKNITLSQLYTNHSVRTTGITALNRSHFGQKQIMAVSGHKSLSSLAIYERVSDREKMAMGHAMADALSENPQGKFKKKKSKIGLHLLFLLIKVY